MANTEENAVVRKSVARQASDLCDKVEKLKAAEAGIVEATRMKHRAKIAALVAGAPADVRAKFFALSGKDGEE
jgi:hypothetical protein